MEGDRVVPSWVGVVSNSDRLSIVYPNSKTKTECGGNILNNVYHVRFFVVFFAEIMWKLWHEDPLNPMGWWSLSQRHSRASRWRNST